MVSKSFFINFLLLYIFFILVIASAVVFADPLFHFHKPVNFLQYDLQNGDARYQNYGIGKNWDYNAIITGTSMTQNFKSSEVDVLFSVNSIKVPFSGAGWKEVNDFLDTSIQTKKKKNERISLILRGLDANQILKDKDYSGLDEYPDFLYDENVFNDLKYLFNKDLFKQYFIHNLLYTLKGNKTTSFDTYHNWNNRYVFNEKTVWDSYKNVRVLDKNEEKNLSLTDKKSIEDSVNQNIKRLIMNNPDIEFYYFFTPYSILYWDDLNQNGDLKRTIEALKYATSLLCTCNNLHLFCFFDEYEMITNLNNYKDAGHYGEWINSYILNSMQKGLHELTVQNYEDYWDASFDYYSSYDYNALIDYLCEI